MGYYTRVKWAIVGPDETIKSICSSLEDAQCDINELYVRTGLIRRIDLQRWREGKMSEEEALKTHIQTFYGECTSFRYQQGSKNSSVIINTVNKYWFDHIGPMLERRYKDIKAFGMYWDDGMAETGEAFPYTDDTEGQFWKRYCLEQYDDNGALLLVRKTNSPEQLFSIVKDITGETMNGDTIEEFDRLNSLFPNIYIQKTITK